MFLTLAIKYCVLAFIAVTGVLQAAAAYNHLDGLRFFSKKSHTLIFAAVCTALPLAGFFSWNYFSATGVIEGGQQAGLFAISTAAAIALNMAAGSVAGHYRMKRQRPAGKGIEIFESTTPYRAIQDKLNGKNR